jgi:formate dehydrogenase subunit gamma
MSVARFTPAERAYHWIYALAFIVLAVTGFILFVPWTAFAAGEAGQTTRLVHRLASVPLLAAPLLMLIACRRRFLGDLREAFTWRRDDWVSLRVLITRSYWTGDKDGLPPQGKFMAGQKLNIVFQAVTFVALGVTGLALWLGKGALPAGLMNGLVLLHALSAILATCIAIVHIYMVTTMPFTRGAIGTMFTGRMPDDLARSHHARWYEGASGKDA